MRLDELVGLMIHFGEKAPASVTTRELKLIGDGSMRQGVLKLMIESFKAGKNLKNAPSVLRQIKVR